MRILDSIRKIIQESLGNRLLKEIDEISENDDLSLLGLNSLDFIRLLVDLEKYFGISVEDDDLQITKFNTISKIKNYFQTC